MRPSVLSMLLDDSLKSCSIKKCRFIARARCSQRSSGAARAPQSVLFQGVGELADGIHHLPCAALDFFDDITGLVD